MLSMAQDDSVLNGDFDHNGQITEADVSVLADICIAKRSFVKGVAQQGVIQFQTVNQYIPSEDTFLVGDMNRDGRITIYDVAALIALQGHPEQYIYAVIRDGKIVQGYIVGQLFIPIEEDSFIDDGEIEF